MKCMKEEKEIDFVNFYQPVTQFTNMWNVGLLKYVLVSCRICAGFVDGTLREHVHRLILAPFIIDRTKLIVCMHGFKCVFRLIEGAAPEPLELIEDKFNFQLQNSKNSTNLQTFIFWKNFSDKDLNYKKYIKNLNWLIDELNFFVTFLNI